MRTNSNPESILSEKVFVIDTDIQTAETQVEIVEADDEEDDLDEEDEDEEMKDISFKIFKRFDKADQGHILRYCNKEGTKPIFYSDYDQFDPAKVEACPGCGKARVFELLLNVQILSVCSALTELDWGIVGIYTCPTSCVPKNGPGQYSEEIGLLQLAPEDIDRLNMQRMQDRKLKEFEADMNEDGPEMPDEEEIARIQKLIRQEEAADRENKKNKKKQSKQPANSRQTEIDEKEAKKKLFEEEDEDDWE